MRVIYPNEKRTVKITEIQEGEVFEYGTGDNKTFAIRIVDSFARDSIPSVCLRSGITHYYNKETEVIPHPFAKVVL